MKYLFDISQLEILSMLTFDASINFEDLQQKPVSGKIKFTIERRTYENVRRTKFLFWDQTEYQGKKSELKFSGIKSIRLEGIDEHFRDNHFINEFGFNKESGRIEMATSFGLLVEFEIDANINIELSDIEDSDFGSGKSSGKHGFTKDEWTEYLIEKKYAT